MIVVPCGVRAATSALVLPGIPAPAWARPREHRPVPIRPGLQPQVLRGHAPEAGLPSTGLRFHLRAGSQGAHQRLVRPQLHVCLTSWATSAVPTEVSWSICQSTRRPAKRTLAQAGMSLSYSMLPTCWGNLFRQISISAMVALPVIAAVYASGSSTALVLFGNTGATSTAPLLCGNTVACGNRIEHHLGRKYSPSTVLGARVSAVTLSAEKDSY